MSMMVNERPPTSRCYLLGLVWDRSWPEERINKMAARHDDFMALCSLPACLLRPGTNEELWRIAGAKEPPWP